MQWIRESKPVQPIPGLGLMLVPLPGQRYVQGDDGQWYAEWHMYDLADLDFPLLRSLPPLPASRRQLKAEAENA